jgi:hypothetical protein
VIHGGDNAGGQLRDPAKALGLTILENARHLLANDGPSHVIGWWN